MDKIFEKFYSLCEKFIKNKKLMSLIREVVSKETVLYIFFGVLTAVVNLTTLSLLIKFIDILIANVIAWVAAIAFSFIANKLFVFKSKGKSFKAVLAEILSFAGARVLTLSIEELGLLVLIKWLHLDVPLTLPFVSGEIVIKVIVSILVIVINYIFNKFLIFRKK